MGYLRVRGLVPDPELERLRALFAVPAQSRSTVVRSVDPGAVEGLAAFGSARRAVESVVGAPVRVEFAQWYCKPARSLQSVIPWHQDRAFWSSRRPPTTTAWIALDDCRTVNGCMHVLPRSHGGSSLRAHAAVAGSSIRGCSVDVTEVEIPMEIEAGEALLYHERLVHRSGGNATDAPRRALVLGWSVI